jgi:Uma2 family endonuclease
MKQAPLTVWRWARVDYDRLVGLGLFHGAPVELIGGQLVVAEPQGSYHATALGAVDDALRAAIPHGWFVRTQMPLALDEDSEPEPDVALVRGAREDFRERHPARPALAIEVAESSLAFDREDKGSLYARAAIQDYWIVNLVDHVVEVYREPRADPTARHGWRYQVADRYAPPATVSPLALPEVRIAAGDLLPRPGPRP